jgi:hypothetical protein
MKSSHLTSSSVAVACLVACLLATAARGADPTVLNLPHEQQKGVNLCWAAVSTMAVRVFPTESEDPAITQELTVVYGLSRVHNRFQRKYTRKINFDNFEQRCRNLAECDRAFQPWLYRIRSNEVGKGKVLPEAAIAHEIGAGRPVILRWDYSGILPPRADLPKGEHALIITGHDADNHKVRIFDPWPPADGTDPSLSEQWFPYEVYVDPRVGMGLEIRAKHAHDLYKMRPIGTSAPENVPSPVRLVSARPAFLTPVTFAAALEGAQPVIDEVMRKRVVLGSDGHALPGEFDAAPAIPIVAISAAGLVKAGVQPENLLVQRTSALLVPITRKGQHEVVDSFQVYNDAGTWIAGGYSNTAIVSQAVQARREQARDAGSLRDFYLVSIPERSAFFLGHGQGPDAMVVSLVREPEQGLVPGRYALGGVLDALLGVKPKTFQAAR